MGWKEGERGRDDQLVKEREGRESGERRKKTKRGKWERGEGEREGVSEK